MRKTVWCVLLSLLAANTQEASDGTQVDVAVPVRRDLSDWIRLPANTEAEVEVSLYARATGFLRDFKLDVGDRIKPGDVIGVIEAPDLEQDVKLAQGQLIFAQAEVSAAEAQLARVKIRSLELDAKEAIAQADIAKEKSELLLSGKQYERTKRLFDTNAATEEARETSELTVKVHDAAVASSTSKMQAIAAERAALEKDIDAAKAVVASAEGKRAIAQATVERAQVFLSFAKIVVPQLGLSRPAATARVIKRFVSNGDLIGGGATSSKSGQQPLVTVVVSDPMRVITDVPEGESNAVRTGTQTRVIFSALPENPPLEGTIARLSPSLVASTRSLHIEMDVPNPKGVLRAGMMAYVDISTGLHKNILAVPTTAVQSTKVGCAVFTIDDGKAKRIPVQIGYTDHAWTEISGGDLTEHTLVIKDVSKGMSEGTPVQTGITAQAVTR